MEFSRLIIDYQRRLRESADSLNASEELSRKLSMEVSVTHGSDIVHILLAVHFFFPFLFPILQTDVLFET